MVSRRNRKISQRLLSGCLEYTVQRANVFPSFAVAGIGVGVETMKRALNGDWPAQVRPVLDLWKVLNKGANLTGSPIVTTATTTDKRPVDAFVEQEWNFAVRLVRVVHGTLAAVNRAIRDNARPSPAVSDTVSSLLQLRVSRRDSSGRYNWGQSRSSSIFFSPQTLDEHSRLFFFFYKFPNKKFVKKKLRF